MRRIILFAVAAFMIGISSPFLSRDVVARDECASGFCQTKPVGVPASPVKCAFGTCTWNGVSMSKVAQAEQPPVVAPVTQPPPATQNTITTTAPVSSNTTISVGTLAGQVLTWAATAFGSLLATVFAAWGVRLFKLAGVQMTDAMRDRLQEIILNGLNAAAKQETQNLAGKGQVEIKNAVVAQAVAYTQDHGAETIKALGLDPKSGEAVEAIKARIETAIADPTVPTPTVLDPAAPQKAA